MKSGERSPAIGFSAKLFLSYFIFAIALTVTLTAVHVHFSDKQQENRFKTQARELLVGKIALLKEYVSQGSPVGRLHWLMEHLHTSESFIAWCLVPEGRYLAITGDGWGWKEELPPEILEAARTLMEKVDPEKGFLIDGDSRMILVPIHALETPYGNPYMLYTARRENVMSVQDNITMTLIMGVLMVVLAVPFAYFISRPLNQAHLALNRRSHDLQNQIDRAAEELTKKDRMLSNQSKLAAIGEMIGNISHQWRLPLTRIQLVLQNLQLSGRRGDLDAVVLNKGVLQAKEQIEFMSETIDTFQDFYRIDARGRFDLAECVESIHRIVGPLLEHKGIRFEHDILHNIEVNGSRQELGQVLLNIIGNAKFALTSNQVENPYVSLKGRLVDSMVILEIRDNAGGIPPEYIPHIFESHFTTKDSEGTGLGLYMSKIIIEEHFHGTINASNAEEGACFEIAVPILAWPLVAH